MMHMRRPSWFAVLLALVGVIAFVWLGLWQLDRAVQKEQILARFANAKHVPTVAFTRLPADLPAERYPHVTAHVQYLAQHVYVLDDQIHNGRRGVQVYTPALLLPDCAAESASDCHALSSRVLLIDMGFLPRAAAGPRHVPDVPPLKSTRTTVSGLVAPPPAPGLKLGGNALARQPTWPKLTIYIDLKQISDDLGRPIYPRVLLLDHDPASPYIRAWKPQTMPPARHRAYAFQWFCFAAAVLVIFYILHRPKRAPDAPDDDFNDDDDGQT